METTNPKNEYYKKYRLDNITKWNAIQRKSQLKNGMNWKTRRTCCGRLPLSEEHKQQISNNAKQRAKQRYTDNIEDKLKYASEYFQQHKEERKLYLREYRKTKKLKKLEIIKNNIIEINKIIE